jgi:hypothetical protein
MSQSSHLAQLERKHRALDDELKYELAHAARNEARIASIKRQKLVLKDEITRLRTGKPPEKRQLH